jgi:hypothetical protein
MREEIVPLQFGRNTKNILTIWAEEICQILVQKLVNLKHQTVQTNSWTMFTLVDHALVRPLLDWKIHLQLSVKVASQVAVPGSFMDESILNSLELHCTFVTRVQGFASSILFSLRICLFLNQQCCIFIYLYLFFFIMTIVKGSISMEYLNIKETIW